MYGIYKQNYVETSLDWVLVLNDAIIDIYKAEGLRNFPHRGVNVYVWNRVKMTHNPVRLKDYYKQTYFRETSLEAARSSQHHAETSMTS